MVPVFVYLPLGILSFAAGIFFAAKSVAVIFGGTLVGRIGEPRFIATGVYAWVRHPMYLGTLLFLLGFFFMTLSLLSLAAWIGFFVFFDRMAAYEERDLIRILGEQYLNYQTHVPKWLMHLRRGNG